MVEKEREPLPERGQEMGLQSLPHAQPRVRRQRIGAILLGLAALVLGAGTVTCCPPGSAEIT